MGVVSGEGGALEPLRPQRDWFIGAVSREFIGCPGKRVPGETRRECPADILPGAR